MSSSNALYTNIKTIFYGVLIALVFRSFLFEPFHIPSGSMKSTLLVGDYLFVSKYSYGYSRYSFPFGARFHYFDDRMPEGMPERGDVVVFRLPTDVTIDYIKRVIGLPGDEVQVKNGKVWLNGEMLEYERAEDYASVEQGGRRVKNLLRFEETLPNGRSYFVLDELRNQPADNTNTYVVPEGHVFVMGDNRDNSVDSRFQDEVGFVPVENIIGRAEIVLFSVNFDSNESFWSFDWLRTERFVQEIG